MKPSAHSILFLSVLMFSASDPTFAQSASVPPGRLLASNCFQCHGTNGKGPGFDELAGKSARKLINELKEYQSGEEGTGIMADHALGYSDAQIRELAQWLSTQQ